jgi:type 1 glutamine amidotransferase
MTTTSVRTARRRARGLWFGFRLRQRIGLGGADDSLSTELRLGDGALAARVASKTIAASSSRRRLPLLALLLAMFSPDACLTPIARADSGGALSTNERLLAALIVDGVNNHDWEAGTRGIRALLAAAQRFRVDVSTTPPREAPAEAWNAWRPDFARYDVVIVNFNGGHKEDGLRWPAEVEQALERYVLGGGGLVIFHAANNAFLQWPAYNEMIGLGWRDKTFGPGLAIGDDGASVITIPAGSGLPPGHGPRHDFELCVAAPVHPITRDLPRCWMHPSEQLTHGQHGPAVGLTILTYARSEVSKQNEPMDWVSRVGKGRVYVTMLGHTWKNEPNPNLDDVNFQTLVARGTEWAASGIVTIPAPGPR